MIAPPRGIDHIAIAVENLDAAIAVSEPCSE